MKGKYGEAYNLCATRTYRIHEILHAAIELAGVKVEIRPVPRLMRPSDEKIIFGSTQKIRRDTGWRSERTIKQTLQSMLEHWEAIL
jgi:nucleoside-diphosphate-sugar epimerase